MTILLILFSLFFAALAIYNLQLAISLLIFLLPAYLIRFQVGPLPSTLLEVMIWLVFLIWLFKNYRQIIDNLRIKFNKNPKSKIQNLKLINYPFGREIIALLVISFVAAGVSGFTNSALGIWKAYFFDPILLYIVVMNVFYDGFKLSKLFWPLCISASAVSLLAIYQKITGNLIDNPFWAAAATRRAVSFFGYPNAVGLYLGPLALLFLGWFCYAKFICRAPRKFLLPIALSMSLSFIAIIIAKSAGAMLGVAVGLSVFCLLASRRTRIAFIAITVLAVVGCAVIPLARHTVPDKLMLRDFSGTVRRIGWNDTWKMLSDGRLIFGAGLTNFQATVKPYHQQGFFVSDGTSDFWERLKTDAALRARTWQPLEIYLYPHNILLNFWSELGLAGMLLFTWIIGKYFFILIKNLKSKTQNQNNQYYYLELGLMSSMVVIVMHGLVDVPYFKNDLAVIFWLMIAMLSLINNYQSKNTL
jgi:O-antigen ligase